jgi:hypothetical protein
MTPDARSFTLTDEQRTAVLRPLFEALRDRMRGADDILERLLIEPLAQPASADLDSHLRRIEEAIGAVRVLGWPSGPAEAATARANGSQEG